MATRMSSRTIGLIAAAVLAGVALYAFFFIQVFHESAPVTIAREHYMQGQEPMFTLYYYRGVKHVSYSLSYYYFKVGAYSEWVDLNEWA